MVQTKDFILKVDPLSGDGEHMCNKLFNQPLIHEEPHNMPMISIWGQGKANSTF